MPASRAVSIIPCPLGTWISRPSIVTVTSSGLLTGALPLQSARYACGGRSYARSGWWPGVAPLALLQTGASRRHLDLGADAGVMVVDRRHHVGEGGPPA